MNNEGGSIIARSTNKMDHGVVRTTIFTLRGREMSWNHRTNYADRWTERLLIRKNTSRTPEKWGIGWPRQSIMCRVVCTKNPNCAMLSVERIDNKSIDTNTTLADLAHWHYYSRTLNLTSSTNPNRFLLVRGWQKRTETSFIFILREGGFGWFAAFLLMTNTVRFKLKTLLFGENHEQ